MADIVIRTNNVPRDFVDAWELSPKERAEFDYIDWQAIEDGRCRATFFRYKGVLYDLGEFQRLHDNGRVHDEAQARAAMLEKVRAILATNC